MNNQLLWNKASYFGSGALDHLGHEVCQRGHKKALLLMDRLLVQYGMAGMIMEMMDYWKQQYEFFTLLYLRPTVQDASMGLSAFTETGADYMVAVGSAATHVAKAIAVAAGSSSEPAQMLRQEGVIQANWPVPRIYTVPALTGALGGAPDVELLDMEDRRRYRYTCPQAVPEAIFVDPRVSARLPREVVGATGADVFCRAMEGFLSPDDWALADMFNKESIRLLNSNLRRAYSGEENGLELTGMAQYAAGLGFSPVRQGLTYAMTQAVSDTYEEVPRGYVAGVLMNTVMQFNADSTGDKYREIAKMMGGEAITFNFSLEQSREAAIGGVRALLTDAGIPDSLRDLGIRREDLPALAARAARELLVGNPRPAGQEDIEALFRKAFAPQE